MSVLLINIILELEGNALLDMSAQREAVHPIHVTLDIMQLCQEWPLVTCVQQVRGVTIIGVVVFIIIVIVPSPTPYKFLLYYTFLSEIVTLIQLHGDHRKGCNHLR